MRLLSKVCTLAPLASEVSGASGGGSAGEMSKVTRHSGTEALVAGFWNMKLSRFPMWPICTASRSLGLKGGLALPGLFPPLRGRTSPQAPTAVGDIPDVSAFDARQFDLRPSRGAPTHARRHARRCPDSVRLTHRQSASTRVISVGTAKRVTRRPQVQDHRPGRVRRRRGARRSELRRRISGRTSPGLRCDNRMPYPRLTVNSFARATG